MKHEIHIEFDGKSEVAPLYHIYPGQVTVQPAYIELEPGTGVVRADWAAEIGNGVPEAVWNKRIIRFYIPPASKGEAIDAFLNREDIIECFEKICKGYETVFDNGNLVGTYTEEAEDAIEEVEARIERFFSLYPDNVACVYDVNTYISETPLDSLWPKDFDSVDKVIEEIKNAHLYCDVYVYCANKYDDEIKKTLLDNLAYRIENGHIEPESIHDNMKKALLNEQPERFKEIFDEIFDEEAEADKDVNVMGDSDTEMTGIHTPKN